MTPAKLAAIHAAAFHSTRSWDEAEFASLLNAPSSLLSVQGAAFVLGRVLFDEAEILTLACHPDSQRQGNSARALAQFEADANAAGALRVFLEVAEDNRAAKALYASAGYAQTGRRPGYYRTKSGQNVSALVLTKSLSPA